MRNVTKGRSYPELWNSIWNAILPLREAFSREITFMWFATAVVGMLVRTEVLGVTSIVRALNLKPGYYDPLVKFFQSRAVKLDKLAVLWAHAVLRLFTNPVRFNDRLVLVGDGIKIPKSGKQMPAVKLMHQQSNHSTKPEYIMGHSLQAVAVLVNAASSFFAVPLAARIHEGVVWSNRDKRTVLDKMLGLLKLLVIKEKYYFVADAYYAAGKMINGLLKQDNHLVTRVKSNAVAYLPAPPRCGGNVRGRPRIYGDRLPVRSLLDQFKLMQAARINLYGDNSVDILFNTRDLMWRPAGRLVRFVAVVYPGRGAILLMSTDLTLSAVDIIKIYSLRFKIEHMFKQAIHVLGTFSYHFWMKNMKPRDSRSKNQYLHRDPDEYREKVRSKIHAYHLFMQVGLIAQGLLQYLSVEMPDLVWNSFGSWLRTIRPGIPPSELVVGNVMRNTIAEFLLNCGKGHPLAKFIAKRQDFERMRIFRLVS